MKLADLIFDRIKHGDEQHQQWLREKSHEIASEYLAQRPNLPTVRSSRCHRACALAVETIKKVITD